jgi:tetratricopeptide (TPR) repeat protein
MKLRTRVLRASTVVMILSAIAGAIGCESSPTKEGDWFAGGAELPPNEETLRMTARILAAKGEFAKAGFAVDRMISDFPDRPGTYTEGAEILLQQGRVQDAVALLDDGLGRLPGNAILHNDRGLCRLLNADLAGATQDFEAALEVDPGDADFVANTALAAALAGDEAKARALWGRVLPEDAVESNLAIARGARSRFSHGK